jgi:hypothetical protein
VGLEEQWIFPRAVGRASESADSKYRDPRATVTRARPAMARARAGSLSSRPIESNAQHLVKPKPVKVHRARAGRGDAETGSCRLNSPPPGRPLACTGPTTTRAYLEGKIVRRPIDPLNLPDFVFFLIRDPVMLIDRFLNLAGS